MLADALANQAKVCIAHIDVFKLLGPAVSIKIVIVPRRNVPNRPPNAIAFFLCPLLEIHDR